ncbi:hypothetical protein [Microbacterium jejuense]|uniref:hypothetical protein n=1 Tax=Microbacterium jejuense TaxID=1263637 RepID=UPI0031E8F60A
MPNQPKTPQWTYRAPLETQMKARARAKREGTNLVAKINEWLEEYAADDSDQDPAGAPST